MNESGQKIIPTLMELTCRGLGSVLLGSRRAAGAGRCKMTSPDFLSVPVCTRGGHAPRAVPGGSSVGKTGLGEENGLCWIFSPGRVPGCVPVPGQHAGQGHISLCSPHPPPLTFIKRCQSLDCRWAAVRTELGFLSPLHFPSSCAFFSLPPSLYLSHLISFSFSLSLSFLLSV